MVSISLKTQVMVKSAAIVYMVPVAGLISGAIAGVPLGKEMGMNEGTTSILFSLVGLGLGFMVTVLISRWMSTRGQMTPIITRIIKFGASAPESLMAVDPVCKMMVDPSRAPASVIHKDNTYYFCNPGCKEAFLKQPESYL